MRKRWLAPTGLAAVALVVAACASSGSGGSAGSGGSGGSGGGTSGGSQTASKSVIKTQKIGGMTVLTNAAGRTLYWFVPDTSTQSKCNGQCAKYWPPVTGPASSGQHRITANLGTIKRDDGSTQATYKGHPLYTYVADKAPGQKKGDGLNVNGGVWHAVVIAGAQHHKKSGGGGGGGGYGY